MLSLINAPKIFVQLIYFHSYSQSHSHYDFDFDFDYFYNYDYCYYSHYNNGDNFYEY